MSGRAAGLGLLVALLFGACDSLTEPPLAEVYRETVAGVALVQVESHCEGELDRERIRRELETAVERIVGQGSSPACLDRMVMVFKPRIATGHAEYVPYGQVEIGCGQYGAAEHEPGHWCAYWGEPRHGCWKRMWHGSYKLGSCDGAV